MCLLSLTHTVNLAQKTDNKDNPFIPRQTIIRQNRTIFTLKQVTDDGRCNYSWVWEGVFACSFMERDYGYLSNKGKTNCTRIMSYMAANVNEGVYTDSLLGYNAWSEECQVH